MLSDVTIGANMFPSICWIINSPIKVYTAFEGDKLSATKTAGTAPIKAPKYGIILTIPLKNAKTITNLMFKIHSRINVRTKTTNDKTI